MILVPVNAIPSQVLRTTLGVQPCLLRIYQKTTGLYIDVLLNDVLVIGGVLCLDSVRIVRDPYLGFFGDLVFYDLQGRQDPDYSGLGSRFVLAYLNPSEVNASALSLDLIPTTGAPAAPIVVNPPPPPPPPPVVHPESAAGTSIAGVGPILYDAGNHGYAITAAAQVAVDGVGDPTTGSVTRLYYGANHQVYWQNASALWFTRIGIAAAWLGVVSPVATESPEGTVIASVGPLLYDAPLNFYALNPTGQIVVNAIADPTTANVVQLYYHLRHVYWQNAAGTWFSRQTPTSAWTQTVGPTAVESLDKTSVATVGPVIYDAALNAYTLSLGAQLVTNGIVEAASANLAQLYYSGHQLYTRNTSNVWQTRAGPAAAFVTVLSPILVESADKTLITTVGPRLVDAALHGYTLNAAGQLVVDGAIDASTSGATELYYIGHQVYWRNATAWFTRTTFSAAWIAAANPIPAESPDGTVATPALTAGGGGPTITNATFNVYAVTFTKSVTIDGILQSSAPNTAELYYKSHLVYRQDTSGAWTYQTTPTSGWIATTTPMPVESAEAASVTTVGPVLTTARFDTYGLSAGQQVVFNGVADTTTSSVTRLYYHNHQPYQQNSFGNWYVNTVPATGWITSASPLPVVAAESADGTIVTTVGPTITDAALHVYALNAAGQVTIDGVADATTSAAIELYYHVQQPYWENAGHGWFKKVTPSAAWTATPNPFGIPSAAGTLVSTVGPTIVTAALNAYAINAGRYVTIDSVQQTAAANVLRLYYTAGAVYMENTAFQWFVQTRPTVAFASVANSPIPFTESADRSSVTTIGPAITDATGHVATIATGNTVATDGVADTANTYGVVRLYYLAHQLYHFNGTNWYTRTGPAVPWTGPVASPLPVVLVESAEAASVTTIGPTIVDSALHAYALTAGAQITEDGTLDATTANVVRLYYHSHAVFHLNTAGSWYTKVTPTSAWSGPVASPLPVVGGGTGKFRVANGAFVDPSGAAWHGRGVNVAAYANYYPTSSPGVRAAFPGINFCRMTFEYIDNRAAYPLQPFYDFIDDATANGVVCMLEHHEFPGLQDYNGQMAWYAAIATKYINNPHVWFETRNEPDGGYTALADEQVAVYNAIRNTGNTNPIGICVRGGSYFDYLANQGGKIASMTNVFWDIHMYGWITQDFGGTGVYTDSSPGATNNAIIACVGQASAYGSADGVMPVITGEFGPSTSGDYPVDPNGNELTAIILGRPNSFTAWAVSATTSPGPDSLYVGDGTNNLSPYGQTVANRIRQVP